MESTSNHEAGLMAAWRATGGACGALRETAGQDDGLAALGISRSVLYCGDDGLSATGTTHHTVCRQDDGLEAGGRYTSFGCLLIDDGLEAGNRPTLTFCYVGDDGLAAIPAATHPLFCRVDDGLASGGYASTIGAFCW